MRKAKGDRYSSCVDNDIGRSSAKEGSMKCSGRRQIAESLRMREWETHKFKVSPCSSA